MGGEGRERERAGKVEERFQGVGQDGWGRMEPAVEGPGQGAALHLHLFFVVSPKSTVCFILPQGRRDSCRDRVKSGAGVEGTEGANLTGKSSQT